MVSADGHPRRLSLDLQATLNVHAIDFDVVLGALDLIFDQSPRSVGLPVQPPTQKHLLARSIILLKNGVDEAPYPVDVDSDGIFLIQNSGRFPQWLRELVLETPPDPNHIINQSINNLKPYTSFVAFCGMISRHENESFLSLRRLQWPSVMRARRFTAEDLCIKMAGNFVPGMKIVGVFCGTGSGGQATRPLILVQYTPPADATTFSGFAGARVSSVGPLQFAVRLKDFEYDMYVCLLSMHGMVELLDARNIEPVFDSDGRCVSYMSPRDWLASHARITITPKNVLGYASCQQTTEFTDSHVQIVPGGYTRVYRHVGRITCTNNTHAQFRPDTPDETGDAAEFTMTISLSNGIRKDVSGVLTEVVYHVNDEAFHFKRFDCVPNDESDRTMLYTPSTGLVSRGANDRVCAYLRFICSECLICRGANMRVSGNYAFPADVTNADILSALDTSVVPASKMAALVRYMLHLSPDLPQIDDQLGHDMVNLLSRDEGNDFLRIKIPCIGMPSDHLLLSTEAWMEQVQSETVESTHTQLCKMHGLPLNTVFVGKRRVSAIICSPGMISGHIFTDGRRFIKKGPSGGGVVLYQGLDSETVVSRVRMFTRFQNGNDRFFHTDKATFSHSTSAVYVYKEGLPERPLLTAELGCINVSDLPCLPNVKYKGLRYFRNTLLGEQFSVDGVDAFTFLDSRYQHKRR